MTTTVLRVKRRLDENPADALIIHCKRAKLEETNITPSVFVFSATVDEKDDNLEFIKSALNKTKDRDSNRNKLKNTEDLKSKLKETNYKDDKRMKIINYTRGLYIGDVEDKSTEYALIEVQNNNSEISNDNYAIDLYLSQGNTLAINDIEDLEGILPVNQDFIYESYRNVNDMISSEDDVDEDDSNDENNWRNDYPDSDNSINENDMIRAVLNVHIGDDLSSDDEDVYAMSGSQKDFNGVSPEDIDRYGLAYAKYKARVLKVQSDPDMPGLIEEHPDSDYPGNMGDYNSDSSRNSFSGISDGDNSNSD